MATRKYYETFENATSSNGVISGLSGGITYFANHEGEGSAYQWIQGYEHVGTPAPYAGSRCLGMDLTVGASRRNEWLLWATDLGLYPSNPTGEFYYKAYFWLPSDFSVNGPADSAYFSLFQSSSQGFPIYSFMLGLPNVNGTFPAMLYIRDQNNNPSVGAQINISLPRGQWFKFEWWQRYSYNGEIKVWINGNLLWDYTGDCHFDTASYGAWFLSTNLYYNSDDYRYHRIYVDEVEVWDGMPSTGGGGGTPPTPVQPVWQHSGALSSLDELGIGYYVVGSGCYVGPAQAPDGTNCIVTRANVGNEHRAELDLFPQSLCASNEMYFSADVWVGNDIVDDGWLAIFQINGRTGAAFPIYSIMINNNALLYIRDNDGQQYNGTGVAYQTNYTFPRNQWVHFDWYTKISSNGLIVCWANGQKLFEFSYDTSGLLWVSDGWFINPCIYGSFGSIYWKNLKIYDQNINGEYIPTDPPDDPPDNPTDPNPSAIHKYSDSYEACYPDPDNPDHVPAGLHNGATAWVHLGNTDEAQPATGYWGVTGVTNYDIQPFVGSRCIKLALLAGNSKMIEFNYYNNQFGIKTGLYCSLYLWLPADFATYTGTGPPTCDIFHVNSGAPWVPNWKVQIGHSAGPVFPIYFVYIDSNNVQHAIGHQNIVLPRGQWFHFEYYQHFGSSDGYVQMWINSQKILEVKNVNTLMTGDWSFGPCIQFNQDNPYLHLMYFDNIDVWDGNPWVSGGGGGTDPPVATKIWKTNFENASMNGQVIQDIGIDNWMEYTTGGVTTAHTWIAGYETPPSGTTWQPYASSGQRSLGMQVQYSDPYTSYSRTNEFCIFKDAIEALGGAGCVDTYIYYKFRMCMHRDQRIEGWNDFFRITDGEPDYVPEYKVRFGSNVVQGTGTETQTLIAGINYLSNGNAWYEPSSLLNADFARFVASGIKHISVRMMWSYLEPTRGTISSSQISAIRKVLDAAEANGIKVNLDFWCQFGYSLGFPKWAGDTWFDVLNEPTSSYYIDMIGRVVDLLKDHAAIESWMVMNEPWYNTTAQRDRFIYMFPLMYNAVKSRDPTRLVGARFMLSHCPANAYPDSVYDMFDIQGVTVYLDGGDPNSTRYNSDWSDWDTLVQECIARNKPIWVIEFGDNGTESHNEAYYSNTLAKFAQTPIVKRAYAWAWQTSGYDNESFNIYHGEPDLAYYKLDDYPDTGSGTGTTTNDVFPVTLIYNDVQEWVGGNETQHIVTNPVNVTLPRGEWFTVEYWMQFAESGGRICVWINNQLVVDAQNLNTNFTANWAIGPCINHNNEDYTNWFLWVDDCEIWDDDPLGRVGKGGGTNPPPPPVDTGNLLWHTGFEQAYKITDPTPQVPVPNKSVLGTGTWMWVENYNDDIGGFWIEGVDRISGGVQPYSNLRCLGLEVKIDDAATEYRTAEMHIYPRDYMGATDTVYYKAYNRFGDGTITAGDESEVFFRFFHIESNVNTGERLVPNLAVMLYNWDGQTAQIQLNRNNADGTTDLLDGPYTVAMTAGVWFKLEVYHYNSATNGRFIMWVNGYKYLDYTGNTLIEGALTISNGIGTNATNPNHNKMWIDECEVWDGLPTGEIPDEPPFMIPDPDTPPLVPSGGKWGVVFLNVGTWQPMIAHVRDITYTLNDHEEATIEIPNTAAYRLLVKNETDVGIYYKDKVLFYGITSRPNFEKGKIVVNCYNKVISRLKNSIITAEYESVNAMTILHAICVQAGLKAGIAPNVFVTVKFDHEYCWDAVKWLAKTCQCDIYTSSGNTVNLGAKGQYYQSWAAVRADINSHLLDHEKKKTRVVTLGTDDKGNQIVGAAGAGNRTLVLTDSKGKSVQILNYFSEFQLSLVNREDSAIPVNSTTDDGYYLETGDWVPIPYNERLNLDGAYRIYKIRRTLSTTQIELNVPTSLIEEIMMMLYEKIVNLNPAVSGLPASSGSSSGSTTTTVTNNIAVGLPDWTVYYSNNQYVAAPSIPTMNQLSNASLDTLMGTLMATGPSYIAIKTNGIPMIWHPSGDAIPANLIIEADDADNFTITASDPNTVYLSCGAYTMLKNVSVNDAYGANKVNPRRVHLYYNNRPTTVARMAIWGDCFISTTIGTEDGAYTGSKDRPAIIIDNYGWGDNVFLSSVGDTANNLIFLWQGYGVWTGNGIYADVGCEGGDADGACLLHFSRNNVSKFKVYPTGDVEMLDSAAGVILHDRSNGSRYRLYVSGGSLSLEEL